jgi:hypothetical protein
MVVMMRCPNCNCRDIGKIGSNQYYCWGCFMEFNIAGDHVQLFQVEEDGTLVAFHEEAEETAESVGGI